jgi:hypothetical protein
MHWSDPFLLALLAGFIAVEAAVLVGFIALVQVPLPDPAATSAPPEPPGGPPESWRRAGASGSGRRAGFIPRFGLPLAGVICFGVLLSLTVVSALPYGAMPAVVGWWVAALTLFGLTVRQTLKANIVLALVNIAVLVASGLVDIGR